MEQTETVGQSGLSFKIKANKNFINNTLHPKNKVICNFHRRGEAAYIERELQENL